MQCHAVDEKCITLHRELSKSNAGIISDSHSWLVVWAQICEALRYLHDDAKIIHDIESDNILLTACMPCAAAASSSTKHTLCEYQIVLIDFGKATKKITARNTTILR